MRFFIESSALATQTLTGEDAKHLKDVLRVKVGEQVVLCDETGMDHHCVVTTLGKSAVGYDILSSVPNVNEPNTQITLYQGLPKSPKMELIIQKAVEIGITDIVLVETQRSIVKVKDEGKKIDRWQKIAKSAAMQSQRGRIPQVRYAKWTEAMAEANNHQLALMAYEKEETTTLKQALTEVTVPETVAIYIGPEGGFTPEEVGQATQKTVVPISLGRRILRTETAALVMASQILYELM